MKWYIGLFFNFSPKLAFLRLLHKKYQNRVSQLLLVMKAGETPNTYLSAVLPHSCYFLIYYVFLNTYIHLLYHFL